MVNEQGSNTILRGERRVKGDSYEDVTDRKTCRQTNMWENIVFCLVTLSITITIDFLHTNQQSYISAAIPTLTFQMMMLLDDKCTKKYGKGIIKTVWQMISKCEK